MNRHSFGTFVAGTSNRRSIRTLRGLARRPAGKTVVLSGDVGLGKSHLLAALATALRARGVGTRLTSCEEFVDDLVDLITRGTALDVIFDCKALLIDDIDEYVSYAASRDEFLSLLSEHLPADSLCVLTAATSHGASLARRLERAFMHMGSQRQDVLHLRIERPDRLTMARIVRSKARELGIKAPSALLRDVGARGVREIRDVESSLLASVAQ